MKIPILRYGGTLVTSIQVDLTDQDALEFQSDVLRATRDLTPGRLHRRTEAMSRAESVFLATAEVPDERDESDNGEPDRS